MQYALYKGNSKNTGNAFSFSISKDKKSFWINAVNQVSWDEKSTKTNKASFKGNAKDPEKSISIKINVTELGGIISAIKRFEPWDTVHSYQKEGDRVTTSIKLGIWKRENNPKGDALSLSITSGIKKFGIAIEKGEAEVIRALAEHAIIEMLNSGLTEEE